MLVPLELVIQVGNNSQEFSIKGGGFAFYSFDQKLNYGNIDKAFKQHFSLDVVDADLEFDNNLGLLFAQKLAQFQGGDISFISTDDKGNNFTVILPKNLQEDQKDNCHQINNLSN